VRAYTGVGGNWYLPSFFLGGGWRSTASHLRASNRLGYAPSNCFDFLDFRLVRSER